MFRNKIPPPVLGRFVDVVSNGGENAWREERRKRVAIPRDSE